MDYDRIIDRLYEIQHAHEVSDERDHYNANKLNTKILELNTNIIEMKDKMNEMNDKMNEMNDKINEILTKLT